MGLGRNRGHDLELCTFGCMARIFNRKSLGFFLQRCYEILLPVLWWPATIRIDAMHRRGVATLIIVTPIFRPKLNGFFYVCRDQVSHIK
jgi:hypothetical protein